LKESDFQNNRLENGIKLWQGIWEYKSPGIQSFLAPVKPKTRHLLQAASMTPQSGEVFIGKSMRENFRESPISFAETPKQDDETSICISPKELAFPETIPEEVSSIEEEHVLLLRQDQCDPMIFKTDTNLLYHTHFHASRRSSKSSSQSRDKFFELQEKHGVTRFDFDKIEQFDKKLEEGQKNKGSSSTERDSIDTDIKSPNYQKKSFSRQRQLIMNIREMQ
jgi:protein unc-80